MNLRSDLVGLVQKVSDGGVRLAKNDFGSVLQKTAVFGSVLLN